MMRGLDIFHLPPKIQASLFYGLFQVSGGGPGGLLSGSRVAVASGCQRQESGQGRGGVWVSPEPSLCGHRGCVSASFRAILCLHHSPCFWWLLCPLALSPGVVVLLEISTSL